MKYGKSPGKSPGNGVFIAELFEINCTYLPSTHWCALYYGYIVESTVDNILLFMHSLGIFQNRPAVLKVLKERGVYPINDRMRSINLLIGKNL